MSVPIDIALENKILSLYTGTSVDNLELLNIIKQIKKRWNISC